MKHAYLIAAHNQFGLLKHLLEMLDSSDNDIYLHIDSKAGTIDYEQFRDVLKASQLYIIERRDITWGGYSQVELEVKMLERATCTQHDYYHFISGVDFPIKSMRDINAFFEKNAGKEFIHFDKETKMDEVRYRIGKYHCLQEKIGRRRNALTVIESVLIGIQRLLRVDRTKKSNLIFKKGANWFSITEGMAKYVVQNEKLIRKTFGKSICADELFLQTLVYNSGFRDNLYYSETEGRFFNMRLIDWKRGNPYIFRASDFDELLKSECLFARKFDMETDSEIIEKLQDALQDGK